MMLPRRLGYGTHPLYASQTNGPYVRVRCPIQGLHWIMANLRCTLEGHRWIITAERVNLLNRWPLVDGHRMIRTHLLILRYPASYLMLTNHPHQPSDLEPPTHPVQSMQIGSQSHSPRSWSYIPLSLHRSFVPLTITIVRISKPRGKRQALAALNLWRVNHRSPSAYRHRHLHRYPLRYPV